MEDAENNLRDNNAEAMYAQKVYNFARGNRQLLGLDRILSEVYLSTSTDLWLGL